MSLLEVASSVYVILAVVLLLSWLLFAFVCELSVVYTVVVLSGFLLQLGSAKETDLLFSCRLLCFACFLVLW